MAEKDSIHIELDAKPFNIDSDDMNLSGQLALIEENSMEISSDQNIASNIVNNNMLINNQSTSSTNIRFDRCNEITLGNIVNVAMPQWPRTMSTVSDVASEIEDSIIYKKTPTIKAMMESTQKLNDKYLDIFCIKLGHKFQSLSVHLKIDENDVHQALEDNKQYGTCEVLFQILSKYFQIHDQYRNVGWLTRFLWKNNYKQNVWGVKELFKMLKEIDEEEA
ncbi:protein immune deficiency [Chironomus tepperi]|uniref:protein immune deficiency n=1 Tax=Chironomus tepperi TaxID=113505 RepID=UPI00391F6C12